MIGLYDYDYGDDDCDTFDAEREQQLEDQIDGLLPSLTIEDLEDRCGDYEPILARLRGKQP